MIPDDPDDVSKAVFACVKCDDGAPFPTFGIQLTDCGFREATRTAALPSLLPHQEGITSSPRPHLAHGLSI
jgi:hypothetical protein